MQVIARTLPVLYAFGPFLGALIVGALAFWLGRHSIEAQLRQARTQISLHEEWLRRSRENCAAWEHRYDREKEAHATDQRQFAAMIETLRARELKFAAEYTAKVDAMRQTYDDSLAVFRQRAQLAESKIPKHGPGGKFVSKKVAAE